MRTPSRSRRHSFAAAVGVAVGAAMLLALATGARFSTAHGDEFCQGAPIPEGYGVADGVPYSTHTPSGPAYNPQGIVLFIAAAWKDARTTPAQRACMAEWAAGVLIDGSQLRTFTDADGTTRRARLFLYPFAFSANPSLPTLQAGWVSGLAQGSVMTALADLADRTGDPGYLDEAQLTFNSYLMTPAQGGFVTDQDGVTYSQEYMTTVPSYVLNGHDLATESLILWADRTRDPKALDLARRSLAALHKTSELEEVQSPSGTASSYDLLRGWPAAPLRAVPSGALTVDRTVVADGDGNALSSLSLAVTKATPRAPNLLKNASFSTWKSGVPVGWAVTGQGSHGRVSKGGVAQSIRITSDGSAHIEAHQDIAKLKVATQFTVSWRARLARPVGRPSMPGDVVLLAVCGGRATAVAMADVRSTTMGLESITGKIPAGCAPRVKLYQADGSLPSTVDFAQVNLFTTDAVGRATVPRYPLSVLATPTVSLKLTYSGRGCLQGWAQGRWVTFASLPEAAGRTATVEVPAYLQGRAVNLRYHSAHVGEFDKLYHLTGDTVLRDRALAWLAYAPSAEGHRATLLEPVPVNPDYAAVIPAN
jgi:hypothetical protein